MLWHPRQERAYCPYCDRTQPPRSRPNTGVEMGKWVKLRLGYEEAEGVTIEQQRGMDKTANTRG